MTHKHSIHIVKKTVPQAIKTGLFALWYRNLITRRALARLSEDQLIDLGISHHDRDTETSKPF